MLPRIRVNVAPMEISNLSAKLIELALHAQCGVLTNGTAVSIAAF